MRAGKRGPTGQPVDICAWLAAGNSHAARGDDYSASVSSVGLFSILAQITSTNVSNFHLCDSRESLPRLDNYRISMRNLKRPSIGELQGEAADQVSS